MATGVMPRGDKVDRVSTVKYDSRSWAGAGCKELKYTYAVITLNMKVTDLKHWKELNEMS